MFSFLLIKPRKAQFYIVAAVILCGLAVALVSSSFVVSKNKIVFAELQNNFMRESSMAINSALGSGDDLYTSFEDFVSEFRDFAEERNIEFNLVYLLKDNENIYIRNYVDDVIFVETPVLTTSISSGDILNISAYEYVGIRDGTEDYVFEFEDEHVALRALFEISLR